MKNSIYTIILTFILVSCSSTKKVIEKRCESTFENGYGNILEDKFDLVLNNDTLRLNEVKYECGKSAFYTQKVMYDRFGKWDKAIYPKGKHHPILLWNNVRLFPNNATQFSVAAYGLESEETIYASVLVFDKNNNDLLSENFEFKSELIKYFSELIKSNNSNRRGFYQAYWTMVDPKRWKEIQEYKRNR